VELLNSTFRNQEHDVVVNHVRKLKEGGVKKKVLIPVENIRKPLICAGDYLCIPPSANMSLYYKSI
jgi:hypothetical protein